MRNCLLKANFCLVLANDLGSFRCARTGGERVLVSGGWRRWWVRIWATKGSPHHSSARDNWNTNSHLLWNRQVSTFALFCKRMELKTSGVVGLFLFFVLVWFFFPQKKQGNCFILDECLRHQGRAWCRNQWFLCSLTHWLGYQVKDFAPFQKQKTWK